MENMVRKWKWYVRIYEDETCEVLDRHDYPGIYVRQAQIDITGEKEPSRPSGVITQEEYQRWKAGLMQDGYQIDDRLV